MAANQPLRSSTIGPDNSVVSLGLSMPWLSQGVNAFHSLPNPGSRSLHNSERSRPRVHYQRWEANMIVITISFLFLVYDFIPKLLKVKSTDDVRYFFLGLVLVDIASRSSLYLFIHATQKPI